MAAAPRIVTGQRATPTPTVAARRTQPVRVRSHTSTYGTSTSHAYGGGTSHTNAYGGTTTGAYGAGAVHTTPYGTTADSLCVSSACYLLWVPSTCYRGLLRNNVLQLHLWLDCGCRSRGRDSRHGRWRRRSLFQVPAPKARAPTMQATQRARPTRALLTPTPRLPTLMWRQRTPMLRLRMLMSLLPMRVSLLRAPPTSRIRWVQFMGRYLPAASVPTSREVEPTICAATPGSARPMVRTASSIALSQHRKRGRVRQI